jgi:hypothetical protein
LHHNTPLPPALLKPPPLPPPPSHELEPTAATPGGTTKLPLAVNVNVGNNVCSAAAAVTGSAPAAHPARGGGAARCDGR